MIDVPRGVKARLYDEATIKERITDSTLALFKRRGFCRVETPAIEFFHVLTKGLSKEDANKVIMFTDPAGGGKPLALRSDVTPQIARISATTLKQRPAPIRLCYAETVYRAITRGSGERMELSQAGAELVGSAGPEADAEMAAMALETMKSFGFAKTKIAIGHVGYLKSTMDAIGTNGAGLANIKDALARKDTKALSLALESAGAAGEVYEAINNAPGLYGGAEMIDKAITVNQGAQNAITNLSKTLKALERRGLCDNVTIDLGEMRGFDYYTGVTFEGFAQNIGRGILSGGRYDDLLCVYGEGRPATGFAIDLDLIIDHFYRVDKTDRWNISDGK